MGRSRRAGTAAVAVVALLVTVVYGSALARASTVTPAGTAGSPAAPPYWLVASDGGVFPFGNARFYGSTGNVHLNQPIVGMATDPVTGGYWLVAADGGIFDFNAPFHGSTGNVHLNRPIVGMATDPATGGYWLVASDGGIFDFDAPFYGSTGNVHLNKPIVGMASTSDGRGYYLVASDGGIFNFGDAHFHGSTGNVRLNRPIVGMAADTATGGYWLVASDGGISDFDAPFYGSTAEFPLASPTIGMAATPGGDGYYLTTAAGNVSQFGDAAWKGNAPAPLNRPIVGIATLTPPTICETGPVGSQPGVTNTTMTIGNVSTLTGPLPEMVDAQRGIEAFTAYANALGGLCGRRVIVRSADDNFDASTNASATRTLAPSALAFVGSYSDEDAAGAPTLAADGIPDIGQAQSPQRFDLPDNFSPVPQPAGWNLGPYVYLKQRFPTAAARMAILAENTPETVALAQQERSALESIGYHFVYVDFTLQPTDPNFNNDVYNMESAGADGLIFQGIGLDYARMAANLAAASYHPQFLNWGVGAYGPDLLAAGTAADGSVLVQSEALFDGEDSAGVPAVAIFDHWYEALFHAAPNLYAAYGWMSGLLFAEGLQAGGAPTRTALLAGLHTITNFDAGGLVAPDSPSAKRPPNCYLIVDVTNGHFVRDAVDPKAGFDCANTPDFRYG